MLQFPRNMALFIYSIKGCIYLADIFIYLKMNTDIFEMQCQLGHQLCFNRAVMG